MNKPQAHLLLALMFSATSVAQNGPRITMEQRLERFNSSFEPDIDPKEKITIEGEVESWIKDEDFRNKVLSDESLMEKYRLQIEEGESHFYSRYATTNYGVLVGRSGKKEEAYDFVIRLFKSPNYGARRKAIVILNTMKKEGVDVSDFLKHKGAIRAYSYFLKNQSNSFSVAAGIQFLEENYSLDTENHSELISLVRSVKKRIREDEAEKVKKQSFLAKTCKQIYQKIRQSAGHIKKK